MPSTEPLGNKEYASGLVLQASGLSRAKLSCATLRATRDCLFAQNFACRHQQPPMESAQSSNALGLHAGHSQQTLRIGEVGLEPCELGVEMRLVVYASGPHSETNGLGEGMGNLRAGEA
ncbi:hypothetical protein BP6252_04575 [Coleophoma cylindrospora]|uniref:Uncharacterized protein n=1 Tax=Coleophoma cylindrospora TaxID=1849047 RepID=A0A3D8S0V9_9HELO|nr:hypothetical protein BP6252_04575 [Coleophoma cylindrospora]